MSKSKLDVIFERMLVQWLEQHIADLDYSDFEGFLKENFLALECNDEIIEYIHELLVNVSIEFSDFRN